MVPEPTDPAMQTSAQKMRALARQDDLTIRQFYKTIAASFGGRVVIGTARDVVDDIQAWVEGVAADGFNLCPPVLPLGLYDFLEMVLPGRAECSAPDTPRRRYVRIWGWRRRNTGNLYFARTNRVVVRPRSRFGSNRAVPLLHLRILKQRRRLAREHAGPLIQDDRAVCDGERQADILLHKQDCGALGP